MRRYLEDKHCKLFADFQEVIKEMNGSDSAQTQPLNKQKTINCMLNTHKKYSADSTQQKSIIKSWYC